MLDDFIALSATLTGFPAAQLRGTGQPEPYLDTLVREAGAEVARDLVAAHARSGGEPGAVEAMLADTRLGPPARRVLKMWLTGSWHALPEDWRAEHGGGTESFVVSPEAYTEGLLWPAIGANPSGAKPFGYAMWAQPPRVIPKGG